MPTYSMEDANRAIAEIKALFGPPALLSNEDEAAYYELMLALAVTEQPRNAFELMCLNDMTISEWRKNWFRRQQAFTLDQDIRASRDAGVRRLGAEAAKQERKADDATDLAEMRKMSPADARTFELEMKIEESHSDIMGLLKNGEAEVRHNRFLRANIEFYGAITVQISIEFARRNEAKKLLIWSRECVHYDAPPETIEGEVIAETTIVPVGDAPLVPSIDTKTTETGDNTPSTADAPIDTPVATPVPDSVENSPTGSLDGDAAAPAAEHK